MIDRAGINSPVWLCCFFGISLIASLTACSSVSIVAPDTAKISLELQSPAEVPLLVTVPPGVLPLKYRDKDNDYFVSDEAYTYSVFGKIVAVPGAGICRTKVAPFVVGVFIAAGSCDFHVKEIPIIQDARYSISQSRAIDVQM